MAIEQQGMKLPRIPALALAVALLALALGLAACGEKSRGHDRHANAQPLSLTLDFYPNPDHAGIYMAQKLGYFEEAGLDVSIDAPSDPAAPIKQVAAGRTDLAISYEPEVAAGPRTGPRRGRGRRPRQPAADLADLAEEIGDQRASADLRGKTIATAGIPYQDAFLKTILARAKLTPADVKAVNVGFGLLPALLGGSAQAMLGGYSNVEGVDLRQRGKDPVVTPVDQLGVPDLRRARPGRQPQARCEEDPETIRLFIAALARGTDAAVKQPERGDQGDARSQPGPRPEADRGRGEGDAAAARRRARRASPTAT